MKSGKSVNQSVNQVSTKVSTIFRLYRRTVFKNVKVSTWLTGGLYIKREYLLYSVSLSLSLTHIGVKVSTWLTKRLNSLIVRDLTLKIG